MACIVRHSSDGSHGAPVIGREGDVGNGEVLLRLGCSNEFKGEILALMAFNQATMPKRLAIKRTSHATPGGRRMQWPRRIMRIASKPLIVAVAVRIDPNPLAGRIKRFNAP